MTDQVLTALLPAIGIAAFERHADGSFTSLAPPPAWFARLVGNETFPFLGHVLEEALEFWRRSAAGTQEWGPCAEVDEAGTEFHYKIAAVALNGREILLFELDTASDRLREILQAVRERALSAEMGSDDKGTPRPSMRRSAGEIRELVGQLAASQPTDTQRALIQSLQGKCEELLEGLESAIRWSPLPEIAMRLKPPRI